jgi:hypothetical protein
MRRGELAIRAGQKAARAAAKKPASLIEAVQNKMDERLARTEADHMLKPPPGLTKAAGEVVDLGDLGFLSGYLVDTLENPTMISVDASEQRMHLAAAASTLQMAVDAAQSARAENSLEKMLCHQKLPFCGLSRTTGSRALWRLKAQVRANSRKKTNRKADWRRRWNRAEWGLRGVAFGDGRSIPSTCAFVP